MRPVELVADGPGWPVSPCVARCDLDAVAVSNCALVALLQDGLSIIAVCDSLLCILPPLHRLHTTDVCLEDCSVGSVAFLV